MSAIPNTSLLDLPDLTDAELDIIEARCKAATPGPWMWNLCLSSKRIVLEARIRTFEIIIDFTRWGMGGARPRFRKSLNGDGSHVIMADAEEFAEIVPGRKHHSHWYQTINQPDANFIAHARTDVPRLIAALRKARAAQESSQ